jgi:uncharacterized coiled-coil protein SlyX
MAFESKIALCLEQVRELENILHQVSGKLDDLKQHLQAISEEQCVVEDVKKETLPPVFLGDRITKTVYADLKKSLSLNDRFRFQRNLFENNAALMDKTLDDLNTFSSLQETLDYLNSRFSWDWKNEPTLAFNEILEKRFA